MFRPKLLKCLYYRSLSCCLRVQLSGCCQWALPQVQCSYLHTDQTRTLPERYFLTTPIFYVNAAPHIGHLYTAVIADALSRWYKVLNIPVLFSTGTDEHGLKIQQAAQKAKKHPSEFCDSVSAHFKRLFDEAVVHPSDFIRTTEERHINAVQEFWRTLDSKGYIYKGKYEGWYSTSDEAFLTQDQVQDGPDANGQTCKVSCESGHPVHWTKEENYLFRLSEFGPRLTKWLDSGAVQPSQFETPLRRRIEEGLPDLSVSRQRDRLEWGIPVPGDSTQTIYVWLDALVNYLTVAGYPGELKQWPPDCQIIGRDIISFHAVYWPAFLLAAGLELPRSLLCHCHWTIDHLKMSKSRGNVVDPFDRMTKYTTDGMRYFLLKEGVPHSDGNYSDQKVVECLNSELANTLGNLLSRCTAKAVNPDQLVPTFNAESFHQRASEDDKNMLRDLHNLPDSVDRHYRDVHFYRGLDAIMSQLRQTNAFVQIHKPWELCKVPAEKHWLENVLAVTMETLRVSGILLQPVVPELAGRLLTRLNVPVSHRNWNNLQDLLSSDQLARSLGEDIGVLFSRLKL